MNENGPMGKGIFLHLSSFESNHVLRGVDSKSEVDFAETSFDVALLSRLRSKRTPRSWPCTPFGSFGGSRDS